MNINKGERYESLIFTGRSFNKTLSGRNRLRIEVQCDCGENFDIDKGNWKRQKQCSSCSRSKKSTVNPLIKGTQIGNLIATGNVKSIRAENRKTPRTLKYHELICVCGDSFFVIQEKLTKVKSCNKCHKKNTKFYSLKHGKTKSLEFRLFNSAKSRAKKNGLEFNIELSDIYIPEFCPILGLKLDQRPFKGSNRKPLDNAPALDRVDPGKGYLKENIEVISFRANSIKNDGTAREHELIAEFIEKYERQSR